MEEHVKYNKKAKRIFQEVRYSKRQVASVKKLVTWIKEK